MDSLRAFAASVVVFEHFFKDWGIPSPGIARYAVDLFFTISGFLITLILLQQKADSKPWFTISRFFIRRVLRLFPAYYIFLIAIVVISLITGIWIGEQKNLVYYFLYAPNILMYLHGFGSSLLNHTWSLGVEEQFYLIWPFLIVLLPVRYIPAVVYSFTLVGILSRSFLHLSLPNGLHDINFLPLGCFYTLGTGTILAHWISFRKESMLNFLDRWNYWLVGISLISFLSCLYLNSKYTLLMDISLCTATGGLVYQSYVGYKGISAVLFGNGFLRSIGKISYGLYLYHKPIPLFVILLCKQLNFEIPALAGVALCVAASLLIAYLSHRYFEAPILKLKSKYS